jgi:hypothetical protein
MKPSGVDVALDTVTVPCSAKDLRATFGWLLIEMRSFGAVLSPAERGLLRKIMAHEGAPFLVNELFPKFERGGAEHAMLRHLRAALFIRPEKTGRWEPDEPVAVTPFARMLWERIGEERIFSPPPIGPNASPVDTPTPAPKQSPVTWDNFLEHLYARQKALKSNPAAAPQG